MGKQRNDNLDVVRKAAAKFGAVVSRVRFGKKHVVVYLTKDQRTVRMNVSYGYIEPYKTTGWVRQALTRPLRPIGVKHREVRT
jgi:hypothetical protein